MTKPKHAKAGSPRKTRSLGSGSEPPDFDLGELPPDEDPEGRARYFVKMLDSLAEQGTVEAKRIRSALIQAVAEYGEKSKVNRDEALALMKARLMGLEQGVLQLLSKSTKKLRDKVVEQARKLGASAPGQTARQLADGMNVVLDALETMGRAVMEGRKDLRDQANNLMAKAREIMQPLQK